MSIFWLIALIAFGVVEGVTVGLAPFGLPPAPAVRPHREWAEALYGSDRGNFWWCPL
jgi:hypothetical protein